MKACMKTILSGAALGLALLANSVPSWAGAKNVQEVMVGKTWAIGSVTSARYSGDVTQSISCQTSRTPSFISIGCGATDKTGTKFFCGSYDPNLAELADAMTDYSIIYFAAEPGSATCTNIFISNTSANLR